jgi:hypothetical protein
VDFDGVPDGRMSVSKPHSRTGPRSSPGSTNALDPTALLVTAMLPFIANMSQNQSSPLPTPSTPARSAVGLPSSPIPIPGSELHACLVDFNNAKGIDLIDHESVLANLDLTPDILSDIPVARLGQVTGVVEGKLWKFQAFCKEWNEWLAAKKQREM